MSERLESTPNNERAELKQQMIALAKELAESAETFSFPGITAEAQIAIEQDEATIPDYATYATPLSELLPRFASEGMKVVLGDHPESGNIFVIPAQTGDLARDSLFPHHLDTTHATNERIKSLVQMSTKFRELAR